jgi:hypothetical protein
LHVAAAPRTATAETAAARRTAGAAKAVRQPKIQDAPVGTPHIRFTQKVGIGIVKRKGSDPFFDGQ